MTSQVCGELDEIEEARLAEIGGSRRHYEELASNLAKHASGRD